MKFKVMFITAILIAAASLPAGAQSAPADLIAAYKAGVAAAKCNLGLDSGKSSQLGDAVQRIEQRSGLGQNDLDALWSKTQADADADKAGFCAQAAAGIDGVIASAQ
jgi:Skp family chaperone for outer membrane proteins